MEMTDSKPRRKNIFVIIAIVILILAGIVYLKVYYFIPSKTPTAVTCDDGQGKPVKCNLLLVSLRKGLTNVEMDALEASIVKLGGQVDRFEYVDTWAVTRSSTGSDELRRWHDSLGALPNVTGVDYDQNNTQTVGN